MKASLTLLAVCGVFAISACSGRTLDLGETVGGAGAPPEDTCVPAGPAPKLLAEAANLDAHPGSLAVGAGSLWFGSVSMPAMQLVRVPTLGGSLERVEATGYTGRAVGFVGQNLVYLQGEVQSSDVIKGGYSVRGHGVVVRDLASGASRRLANPGLNAYVEEVAVDVTGAYWTSSERYGVGDPVTLTRWNPSTEATVDLARAQALGAIRLSAGEVFYLAADSDSRGARVEAVAANGGIPRVLLQGSQPGIPVWIAAVDAREVFVEVRDRSSDGSPTDARRIVAVDRRTGASREVVVRRSLPRANDAAEQVGGRGTLSLLAADEASIYTFEDGDPAIKRTSKSGLPTEDFIDLGSGRAVKALTVDRCNVYWLVAEQGTPAVLYARSR